MCYKKRETVIFQQLVQGNILTLRIPCPRIQDPSAYQSPLYNLNSRARRYHNFDNNNKAGHT